MLFKFKAFVASSFVRSVINENLALTRHETIGFLAIVVKPTCSIALPKKSVIGPIILGVVLPMNNSCINFSFGLPPTTVFSGTADIPGGNG